MRLVYLALGWVAGILLAAGGVDLPRMVWTVLALVQAVIVWLSWATPAHRWLSLAVLAFFLGGLRYSYVPQTSDIAYFNNTGGLTIEGVVVAEPDLRDDRVLIRVATEKVNRGGTLYRTDGDVLVRASRFTDVQYGDRVAVTGLLYVPGEYDTFSYADYLARSRIFSLMDQAEVEVLDSGEGFAPLEWLYTQRRNVITGIGEYLPDPQAALLTGILLGYERGIAPELQDDFSAVGASHVVAISGFNMVIVAGVVMGLLERVIPRRRWLAAWIGLTVMVIYTLFAGANAAVVRAAIMSAVLIIGDVLKRKTYVPASLAFVALLMTVFSPSVLWDVSFQLSFFAVLGLALFTEPLQRWLDAMLVWMFAPRSTRGLGGPVARLSGFLAEPLVVTLAAQITTLPIIILYFGRLSLVTVPVNLLIVPVQTYLLLTGGLAVIIALVAAPVAQVFFWFDWLLLSWTIDIVRAFAALPFADTAVQVNPLLIQIYFGVLMGWALMQATQPDWWLNLGRFLRNRVVFSTMIFAGVATVILMVIIARSRPDDRLHVWFLDVGHSNAVLLQTPGGTQVLVDGGQYPSRLLTAIGDRIPFNDQEIEVLFITHPDEFDTAALTSVLSRYDVGTTLTNGQANLGDTITALDEALAETDVQVVTAGYTVNVDDGVTIEVLHPTQTPELGAPMGDGTLVLRVSYGDVSFLLTSDLSEDGQIDLLDGGAWPLATVLQLPQHGTARSLDENFLAAVQPQLVVVQVDPANRRGDPDPDVLAMLPEQIPVLRTDQVDTIHLWTDGETLWTEQKGGG